MSYITVNTDARKRWPIKGGQVHWEITPASNEMEFTAEIVVAIGGVCGVNHAELIDADTIAICVDRGRDPGAITFLINCMLDEDYDRVILEA